MGTRKIGEHYNADATACAKIYKDSDLGEFRVSLWRNGEKIDAADYFTDSQADAESTAQAMICETMISRQPEAAADFDRKLAGALADALAAANSAADQIHSFQTLANGQPGTYGHIRAALVNVIGESGVEFWANTGELPPPPKPKPEAAKRAEIIFASGTRGHNVRADGNGGTLARGHYVRAASGRLCGPFARKADAVTVAELAAVEIDGLEWDKEKREHIDIRVRPYVITADAESGALAIVSAENGDGFADYYGEFRGGYPWISPALESFATERGLIWEWENPGAIALYRA